MRYLFNFLLLLFAAATAKGQDNVQYRIIFISDAETATPGRLQAASLAAAKVIPGKTAAFYMGDNIYPRGMALPGTAKEANTQAILRSQYTQLRQNGAAVYFLPGNYDWDKSGTKGLDKIQAQGKFLNDQGDTLLKMIPANGCPDPVEISLTPELTVIAYDSEWWLFPFNKINDASDCDCKTKQDIIAKLEELRYKNRHRIVLLASHHPFQSYGRYGGKYTLKDYIFPLTAKNKNLYLPVPLLYPVIRSIFPNPQDLKHPLYRDMTSKVNAVFDDFPNLAYIAGHERGMQLIKDEQLQIVSGPGAGNAATKKTGASLFATKKQGFVTADLLTGNKLRFSFYTGENTDAVFSYDMPYTLSDDAATLLGKRIQGDSIMVAIRPGYNKKGKFHRLLFGENYREEWATPAKLPVIRLSEYQGGLKPLQLGGGMQSKSLRLADKDGKEWVIRSVEKGPEALLPEGLRSSFARDWVDDVTSAQHPFSALVVPPIANAVKVPHAKPVIGVISPDKNLGPYGRIFDSLVVLLEEREPLGESDNSVKLKKNLQKDNDNILDGKEVLRARMLDALLGDWDRHEDQWRWFDKDKGKEKEYVAVPRDRDQVFHLTQGLFPKLASQPGILPTLRDFDKNMHKVKWLLFKTRFVNSYPSFQLSREEWQRQAEKFKAAVTDSVLETGLRRMPQEAYAIRHDELMQKLRSRREALPAALDRYYRFSQKIVDIQASDKNELVQLTGEKDGGLRLRISKINKDGVVKDELMNKIYDPKLTKEIRLFLGNGKDSVTINNEHSPIKLRIIGGKDAKSYAITAARKKIKLYDQENGSSFTGKTDRFKKHISNDSLHTAFEETNLYNTIVPAFAIGLNRDDGFILGAGFKYTRQEGFRKKPYASMHQFVASHSFSTSAYRIKYNAEWTKVFGNADISMQALANAPNNTINFFGRGNETVFNKTGDFLRFYRTRFSTFRVDPALRWKGHKGAAFSIGPSLYYYKFDADNNTGRLISDPSLIGSYDSLLIDKNKVHLGVAMQFTRDKRNSKVIPQWGTYINVKVQAYKGMGTYARDFAQVIPELAVYKSINRQSTIVLANRVGGTIGIGKTAFYQSAFLGGHENLLGYRQYRFAGQHSLYNNLELRVKLADVANYIVPGQFGITGFWDIGRVWENNDKSGKWHNGTGAGIYFAPASLLSFNLIMGHSREGWLPYFTMGFRF